MNQKNHNSSGASLIACGIGILTISLAVCFFSLLLFAAPRGLDYSDESYAYFWARYPFEYGFALRLFGFLLHPIELLVQHSMTGFRIAGTLLTAAAGIVVGIVAINPASRTLERVEAVAACAIVMFLGNVYWMNTPSYPHMTTWGLALIVAGCAAFIQQARVPARHLLFTAVLIAAGGFIVAAAKIPSAAAAALVALGVIFFFPGADRVTRWRMLGLIVLVEACLLAAAGAFVSPLRVVEMLGKGLSLRSEFGGLLDLLPKHIADLTDMPPHYILIFAIAASSLLMMIAARSRRRVLGASRLMVATVLSTLATCAALIYADPVTPALNGYYVQHRAVQMIVLASAVIVLTCAVCSWRNREFSRGRLLLATLLILAPWIASLGTANNFLNNTAAYSGFPALAIIIASLEMPRLPGQITRLSMVLVSGGALYLAAQHPYRLNRSILEQNVPVALDGLNGSTLLVDAATAGFLTSLHDRARAAGLAAGTPLFELADYGPGLNLSLGTRPPVYPWVAAGYPNSPAILDRIWSLTPVADRQRAWIIGPIDKSFRPAAAMSELMPLDRNYELVTEIMEPRLGMNIGLWRPRSASREGQ